MASDASTSGFTQFTPETSEKTIVGEIWDGRYYAVPWPGNTYNIFEKQSGLAIHMNSNGGLYLCDIEGDQDKNNQWLCVEKNGYFGFMQTKSGRYMGHNISGDMHAAAFHHEAWELMTPRKHPDGGYELLVPHWWHTLKTVCVAANGVNIVLRQHGTTRWEFVKV